MRFKLSIYIYIYIYTYSHLNCQLQHIYIYIYMLKVGGQVVCNLANLISVDERNKSQEDILR